MPRPKHAMEIFQLLDKSNCRECGEKTCLAFAGAVYQGKRKITECPKLDSQTVKRFSGHDDNIDNTFVEGADFLGQLKTEIAAADLAEAAQRVGAEFANGKLTLKVLGKDFSVDDEVVDYLLSIGREEHPVLAELRRTTATMPGAGMQISPLQGHLMRILLRLTGARRVLEVGTYTGYSALAMALALPDRPPIDLDQSLAVEWRPG